MQVKFSHRFLYPILACHCCRVAGDATAGLDRAHRRSQDPVGETPGGQRAASEWSMVPLICWFNAEMPIEEVPRLSPCPAPPAPPAPAMLSKIPDTNATRNTKLSPNVIGDPGMQMQMPIILYLYLIFLKS